MTTWYYIQNKLQMNIAGKKQIYQGKKRGHKIELNKFTRKYLDYRFYPSIQPSSHLQALISLLVRLMHSIQLLSPTKAEEL